jgi:hypothetical protein
LDGEGGKEKENGKIGRREEDRSEEEKSIV